MAAAATVLRIVFAKSRRRAGLASVMLAMAVALSPTVAARAAPVTLKLSFFTSDRSSIYLCQIKPFVDAVDAEGADLVRVKVYFSGGINSVLTDQPKLVARDVADLAIIAPGYTPQQFPDSSVMELPGLFGNEREASLVFTRLVQAGALAGYKDFFVIGAFVTAGESIHSRKPIAKLADLKGQRIRVNNPIEGEVLKRFGAVPFLLPINRTMDDLNAGKLDGVTVPPSMLFEFGFGRLTGHHYLLHLGGAPIALVMNRAKFASLQQPVQEIIRKHSGDWLAKQEAACFDAKNRATVARLKVDSRRKVVEPSQADRVTIRRVFASVVEQWAAQSARHRKLLALARAAIADLRSRK